MHWVILLLYLIRRLLHVSASMCHLQGASYVLMSYLKADMVMLFVTYCECWWPVCTGCCSSVRYVVQLSAEQKYPRILWNPHLSLSWDRPIQSTPLVLFLKESFHMTYLRLGLPCSLFTLVFTTTILFRALYKTHCISVFAIFRQCSLSQDRPVHSALSKESLFQTKLQFFLQIRSFGFSSPRHIAD
jgi:hypothetical protein